LSNGVVGKLGAAHPIHPTLDATHQFFLLFHCMLGQLMVVLGPWQPAIM
jgi:hypothetical protein